MEFMSVEKHIEKNKKIKFNKLLIIALVVMFFQVLFIGNTYATEELVNINLTQEDIYKLRENVLSEEKVEAPKKFSLYSTTPSIGDYLIECVKNYETTVDVSSYKTYENDVESTILPLLGEPSLFYFDPENISYYRTYDSATSKYIVTKFVFSYLYTKDEVNQINAQLDLVVDDYLSGVKSEWNDLEKIIYTNNYLCQECEYASNIIPSSHTIYGALIDKLPVCDGYSKAFVYLLREVGVDALLVTSYAMQHGWNVVKLGDDYYHIDVTWNDIKGIGKTTYSYFLNSDSKFLSSKDHYSWVIDNNQKATNTQYDTNNEWESITNYLIYKNNYWYALNNTKQSTSVYLRKIDFRNATTTEVKQISVSPEFVLFAPGLTSDGDNLYFTTQYKLYRMSFEGDNLLKLFTLDSDKVFFAVEYKDGTIYYDTCDFVNNSASTATRATHTYIPVTGISLNKTEVLLEKGQTEQLVATVTPTNNSDGSKVTWGSSNTSVATVDENGLVTAIGAGETSIFAITTNQISVACKVKVVDEIIFTTYTTVDAEDSQAIVFPTKTVIETILVEEKFPVLGLGYKVEVFDTSEVIKGTTAEIGSKNYIKISDPSGKLVKTYMAIVNGDIDGDGRLRLYDAFQILKGCIVPGTSLNEFDKLIHDSNGDGVIALYDAFQFIKKAIIG